MLNYWFSSYDEICPDKYNYSRFKLKGKCRSEKWEVYLDGDDDQFQEDVGCVCLLNAGSATLTIFALTTTFFPVQVEGQVSQ